MALDLGLSISPTSLPLFDSSAHGFSSNARLRTKLLIPSSIFRSFSGKVTSPSSYSTETNPFMRNGITRITPRKVFSTIPRCSTSSSSDVGKDDSKAPDQAKTPFGYTRKDVLLIGVGVTALGIGLESGLEYVGVNPLQAGNVVQLVLVLGLTIGWIATYIFRVSNKDMTYAQQLRDYENKVMQKRLEGLTEAELEALLEQVEEEKGRLSSGEQVN